MADSEILKELRQFRQENKSNFEELKKDIAAINKRLDEAECRIEKVEERVQTSEEFSSGMLKLYTKLEEKLTDLESRTRRENIRIYGVSEGAEKDSTDMVSFVEKLLREGLGLPEDLDLQIERTHRSLGPLPPASAPPRSIVVKFLSFKTKESVLRKSWRTKGFKWNDKQVNIDQDYPPAIVGKRREYTEIRKVLKENEVQFQTLFPARLRVKHNDGSKIYDTAAEAAEDLVKEAIGSNYCQPRHH
ncbi:hypothetical protein WMY93_001007 [Mugilogobius chulae]|uniref:L1 transposable element RRM domain-containing protein n=1 Tax=Mugilogobius chulae TaxID=88201 RepID=A0AAW0Q0Z4_9GOBI